MPTPPIPDDEEKRLAALYALKVMDTPKEERFDQIISLACNVFDVPFAALIFVDRDRQWGKSVANSGTVDNARNESICAYTILQDDVLVINDTRRDQRVASFSCVSAQEPIIFYAGIAVKTNDGSRVASLCITDSTPRIFSPSECETLITLGKIIESVLNTAQLAKLTTNLIESENKLASLTQALKNNERLAKLRAYSLELVAKGSTLNSVLTAIVQGVELEFEQTICSILLLDEAGEYFFDCVSVSLPEYYNQAIYTVKIGPEVGSCGTAASTGKRMIVEDIDNHPYWQDFTQLTSQVGLRACWSEPIISAKGKVLGTFAIYHRDVRAPSEVELRLIEQSAQLACVAMEHDNADKVIRHQANYDPLTDLANRQLFRELVIQAMSLAQRNKSKFSLLFLDLDRFKEVNDTLGHAVGDELLIECARRLEQCVRASDSVARLGGDEFVVLLATSAQASTSGLVAEKILEQLSQPFHLNNERIYVSASIGITTYPDDGSDYDILLNNADQAMYGAKNKGRNCFEHFNYDMRELAKGRIGLANDLRHALEEQQLQVVYQPIVNLKTHKVEKAEALLRWNHPIKGEIMPLDFIDIAEETGLIFPISEWVMSQVLAQAKYLKNELGHEFKISVNTSPVQYLDEHKNNQGWLKLLIGDVEIRSAIIVEITENILMDCQEHVVEKLDMLRKCGIEIAIDDFGVGYSSMIYLKKYKIDLLKIDKQFVQDLQRDNTDFILCEAMINMAQKLGMEVVAEGIETKQQHGLIETMGCNWGQGYDIAKPLSEHDILNFIIDYKKLDER